MITPRKTFRESPIAKGWLDVVDSQQFQAAATAALAEMSTRYTARDSETAAAIAFKLQGANDYLAILMGLMVPEQKPNAASHQNLDHRI